MKKTRFLSCFILLIVSLVTFSLPGLALAQDEEEGPKIEESVNLRPLYPKVESIAGGNFE